MTRERKTQGKQTRKRTNTTDAGNTRRWRSVRHQIDALDVATFDAIANTKSPLLDATMPRLTRAADRSVLWIVIAGLMTLTGRPRARRGAARGLVSLLFIGNGRYEPRGFAPVHRAALDDSRLDLRVLGVTRLASRARVVLDLFTGRVARNKRYQQFSDAEYHLELPDGPYRIARDGELGEQIDRLDARVLPRALTVIAPARRKKR